MTKNNDLLKNCYRKEDIDTKIIFYQTPKFLIHSEKYKGLGLAEKLVYSVLRDRLELSINNIKEDFVDENGYVFIRFDQEKLGELLNVNKKTVGRYMKHLEENNLIVIIREGRGRSNRIYITDISKELEKIYVYENDKKDRDIEKEKIVLDNENIIEKVKQIKPESIENTLKGQNVTSRSDKKTSLEVTKSPHNDTDIINTDIIKINQSIDKSNNQEDIKNNDGLTDFDKQLKNNGFKTFEELVKYVGVDKKYFEYPHTEWIDSIKKAIWEMYYFENTKILGKKISKYNAIAKLQKLNIDVIISTIEKVIEKTKEEIIKHPVSYIKTAMFNEIDEFSARIQAQVNYDFNHDFYDNKTEDKPQEKHKTRFHNFLQRTDKYSEEELEVIVRRKREKYMEGMGE